MINPKSLKNLIPPVKGEIRNPKGAPRKLPDLQILLAEVLGEEKYGKTAAQRILTALQKRSMKSSVVGNRAAEILLNRGYGLPKQAIDLTNIGETTIRIIRDKDL